MTTRGEEDAAATRGKMMCQPEEKKSQQPEEKSSQPEEKMSWQTEEKSW